MAVTHRSTDQVLDSARKDLQAQLGIVRAEMSRLAAEEHALTQALSSLDGDSALPPSTTTASKPGGRATTKSQAKRGPARKAKSTRRRRPAGATRSTADRVKELEGILADGPKSRNDLAAALKVSPARVQQLLAKLGSSVASQPDPQQRQVKLWSLKGATNGASAANPTTTRATRASTRKPSAREKPTAK